jgi:hypothetical protein
MCNGLSLDSYQAAKLGHTVFPAHQLPAADRPLLSTV